MATPDETAASPGGVATEPEGGGVPRRTSRKYNELNGILLVDKPMDWTSHDVVNFVKHRFSPRKIGHCGTLDPMATGLLVLLLGKATKLQERFMGQSKIYEGSIKLGLETDSEDATGRITSERGAEGITREMLETAMAAMVGDSMQIPPMVSAIKKDGRPLYILARKGVIVERKPRPVSIHSMEMLSCEMPCASFRVHCSKGTYVRTICADIGRKLGCGGIMTALRRLQCGKFSVEVAYTVDQMKSWGYPELENAVMPMERVLALAEGDA